MQRPTDGRGCRQVGATAQTTAAGTHMRPSLPRGLWASGGVGAPRAHRAGGLRPGQQGDHLQARALVAHTLQLRHHLRVPPPLARLPVQRHDVVALPQAGRLRGHGAVESAARAPAPLPPPHKLPLLIPGTWPRGWGRGLTAAGPPGMTAAMRTGASPRSVRPKPASPRVTWTGPTSRQQFLTENTDRGPWRRGEGVSATCPSRHSPSPSLYVSGQKPGVAKGLGRAGPPSRPVWGPHPRQGWATGLNPPVLSWGGVTWAGGAHQPVEDIGHLHRGEAGHPDLWLLLRFS